MTEKLLESILEGNKSIWNNYKNTRRRRIIIYKTDLERIKVDIADYDFELVVFRECTFCTEFINCNFFGAQFEGCFFVKGARFTQSNFSSSVFKRTTFENVDLMNVNFSQCKFNNCDFINVDCKFSSIVKSFFTNCRIKGLELYGANIWDIDIDKRTSQQDIIIPYKEFKGSGTQIHLSIDDMQLANIIYLLLDNSNYTKLLQQSKKKCVLLLGRFNKNYKIHLDKLKSLLRDSGFSPIVFDFESPNTLDLIEAIILLSLLSKFIIVDLTSAKSVPAELQAILSTLSIPIVPIVKKNHKVFSTFIATNKYSCVLPIRRFDSIDDFTLEKFKKAIVYPADTLSSEIQNNKKDKKPTTDINKDF